MLHRRLWIPFLVDEGFMFLFIFSQFLFCLLYFLYQNWLLLRKTELNLTRYDFLNFYNFLLHRIFLKMGWKAMKYFQFKLFRLSDFPYSFYRILKLIYYMGNPIQFCLIKNKYLKSKYINKNQLSFILYLFDYFQYLFLCKRFRTD